MANTLSPEEKLFKVIKEGVSRPANGAAGTIPPPVSLTGNLKIKQSSDSPSVLPDKMDVKPLTNDSVAAVNAAARVVPGGSSAEKPASSLPSSLLGYFKEVVQTLAVRYASGRQYFAIFRRIEIINRSLAIVLVLFLGAFIYSAVLGRPSIEKTVRHFPRPPVRSMKANNHEAFMSSDAYVKMSKQRDIFSREQHATVEGVAVADKPDAPRTKTDLQLVGIYFSEEPEVIIEDKTEKKTYFLKEGDNIKGIKVKSIRQDRVILESDGMDWELM